jgi:hypothetical protein
MDRETYIRLRKEAQERIAHRPDWKKRVAESETRQLDEIERFWRQNRPNRTQTSSSS